MSSGPRNAHAVDAVQRQVLELIGRSVTFALLLVATDFVSTRWVIGIADWTLDAKVREGYVSALLTFVGLPSALLVTLTSFALPSLGSYANASLLLLHRQYPVSARRDSDDEPPPGGQRGRLVRMVRAGAFVALGRRNAFHYALQLALLLSAGLYGLVLARSFKVLGQPIGENHVPALAIVTLVAAAELTSLMWFVYWVIRLRQPTEAIQHLQLLARNALRRLRDFGEDTALREARPSELEGPYTCAFEEQEEVKQIALALSQTTLRAVHDHQPYSAMEGVAALARLYAASRQPGYPRSWREMRRVHIQENVRTNWLAELALDALAEVLVAAVELGSAPVGRDAAKRLLTSASDLLATCEPDDEEAAALVRVVLRKHTEGFRACLVHGEPAQRDLLVQQVTKLFDQLASAPSDATATGTRDRKTAWVERLEGALRKQGAVMGEAAVQRNDLGALRGVTDLLHRVARSLPQTKRSVAELVLNVGATALAVRADHCVSVLAAWGSGVLDLGAETIPAEAARLIETEPVVPLVVGGSEEVLLRPDYVTIDYVAVFLALTAGRGIQFGLPGWRDAKDAIRATLRSAPEVRNIEERCTWVCDRVAHVAHFATREREDWVKAVRSVTR